MNAAVKKGLDKAKKLEASVFVDYRNYHYYLEKHSWEVDWERLRDFLSEKYDLVEMYYYDGIPSKAVFFDRSPSASLQDFIDMKQEKKVHFQSLQQKGFMVRKKLVSRVYDTRTHRYKHKCNFDVELAIDAIDSLDRYEVCVLCSGDGDFARLIKYLKGKHKKVVVVAGKDRLGKIAAKAASEVMYLRDIRKDIAIK